MSISRIVQDCRRVAGVRVRESSRLPLETAPLGVGDTVYVARDAAGFEFAGEFDRIEGEETFMTPDEAARDLEGDETIRLLVFRDLRGFYDPMRVPETAAERLEVAMTGGVADEGALAGPRASDDELMWVHHLDLSTNTLYHEEFNDDPVTLP